MHRRVESFEFCHETLIRRQISVDFTLPSTDLPTLRSGTDAFVLVPLTLLQKRLDHEYALSRGVLRRFDLRDEEGAALPLLTSAQNGEIAAGILITVAQYLVRQATPGEVLDDALRCDLRAIAFQPPLQAEAALSSIVNGTGQRRIIWSNPPFRLLARTFTALFLMITPIMAAAGHRRVLKFAYETRSDRLHLTLRERLALRPVNFGSEAGAIAFAGAYHVDFKAPEGLMVASAKLVNARTKDILDEEQAGVTLHLYARDQPLASQALLQTSLNVQSYVVAPVLVASAVITLVLLGGGILHLFDFHPSNALSALIVVLPGLFVAYLARPSDSVVARLTDGLRFGLLTSSLCSFAGAASLSFDDSGLVRQVVWLVFGAVSGVVTALTWVVWRRALRLGARPDRV
jgi:hypothetical protein